MLSVILLCHLGFIRISSDPSGCTQDIPRAAMEELSASENREAPAPAGLSVPAPPALPSVAPSVPGPKRPRKLVPGFLRWILGIAVAFTVIGYSFRRDPPLGPCRIGICQLVADARSARARSFRGLSPAFVSLYAVGVTSTVVLLILTNRADPGIIPPRRGGVLRMLATAARSASRKGRACRTPRLFPGRPAASPAQSLPRPRVAGGQLRQCAAAAGVGQGPVPGADHAPKAGCAGGGRGAVGVAFARGGRDGSRRAGRRRVSEGASDGSKGLAPRRRGCLAAPRRCSSAAAGARVLSEGPRPGALRGHGRGSRGACRGLGRDGALLRDVPHLAAAESSPLLNLRVRPTQTRAPK